MQKFCFFYYLPVFSSSLSNLLVELISPQAIRIFHNLWQFEDIGYQNIVKKRADHFVISNYQSERLLIY